MTRPSLAEVAAADRARLDRSRSPGAAVKAHGCIDKVRYGEQAARTAARILRGRTGGEELHHYPCPFCRCWHVGHGVPTAAAAHRSHWASSRASA